MADKYGVKWVLWFRTIATPYWAVTLGQTTYYSVSQPNAVNLAWRRHEEKHKEQWRRDGWFKFAIKYLYYQIKYGYKGNPYELEARNAENILNS